MPRTFNCLKIMLKQNKEEKKLDNQTGLCLLGAMLPMATRGAASLELPHLQSSICVMLHYFLVFFLCFFSVLLFFFFNFISSLFLPYHSLFLVVVRHVETIDAGGRCSYSPGAAIFHNNCLKILH